MKLNTTTVALLIISAVFTGACSEQSQPQNTTETQTEEQHDLQTLEQRFSYAYGADLGKKFKAEGVELDPLILAAGLRGGYGTGEKYMSDEEVADTIELYLETHREKQEAEWAAAGEKNKIAGEKFLAANAKKEGVIVTESGLQYKIITPGSGDYSPAEFDEITAHYRGRFVDGTEFDSSYQRDKPHVAIVKQLIDGWIEALQMMTEGAKWELYVPAELAYGDRGSEYVGPNAVLIFEVTLLDIKKEKE